MKVLINSTAILSLTLYIVPPFAVQAQDMVDVGGMGVICLPDDQTPCPEGAACVVTYGADCQAAADAAFGAPVPEVIPEEVAPEVIPEEAPVEELPAEVVPEEVPVEEAPVEEAPVEVLPEEAPVEVIPEEVAPEELPAEVIPEEVAPEEAPAEIAPVEVPEEVAPEEVPAEALPEEIVPEEAPAEVIPEEAAPEEAPAEEALPEVTPEDLAATTEDQSAEPMAEESAPADQSAGPAPLQEALPEAQILTEEEVAAQAAQDQAAIEAAKAAEAEAAAAALADPNLQPVEAPVVEEQAAQGLESVLEAAPVAEASSEPTATAVAAPATEAAAAVLDPTAPPAEQPVPATATVTTETVAATDTRSAAQEFAAAPVTVAPGRKSGLSDLEKAGLVALGALAIGTMLNSNKKQVVQNTGDRVVVRQDDGSYQIYKDDNALLREPGSQVTTQTFQDGSTRTIVTRQDGSQIATIRDASGRVLQRVAYDRTGRGTVLIDDLRPEEPIIISELPRPRARVIDITQSDAAMRAALAAAEAEDFGAKYSLRQIRTIPEVRRLAPTINVQEITFTSGSAALDPDQARALNGLGKFIAQMIATNPGEVFLIEGHTDAVGSAASNLTLSDRRAETVAKALTEYFGVPPENMVVQGYGESELLVPTLSDERANRRVSVRIVTPILRQ